MNALEVQGDNMPKKAPEKNMQKSYRITNLAGFRAKIKGKIL